MKKSWMLVLALIAFAGAAFAQNAATPAAPDSTAVATPARPSLAARTSWLGDRAPLRVGDLVTIVVDERTASRERVSQVADGQRSQKTALDANIDSGSGAPTAYDVGINTGLGQKSRDVGEAQRLGDLTAVLTARVTAVEPSGIATIEGTKKVTVDGRLSEVSLKGLIRGEDVSHSNTVLSTRVAGAEILYRGKKISPRSSFVGKLLGTVWP